MNFFAKSQIFPCWISILLRTTAITTGLATITACSSIGISTRKQNSPLPIVLTHAISGVVATARAWETSDRLYVSGQVQHFHGYHLPVTAHVDIQLIGKDSRVLAEKRDKIVLTAHPRTTAGRNRRVSYVASFPIDLARQSSGIRVTYHLKEPSGETIHGTASEDR